MDSPLLNLPVAPLVAEPALYAEAGRELSLEDILMLETTPLGTKPQPLARVREIHHQVARLLAAGMKPVEISAVAGISQSRISILKNDPLFSELVEHYSANEATAFASVRDRLAMLGLDAATVLHERIVEKPDEVGTNTLISILETALDRAGHAPVKRSQNVTTLLTAGDLKELKEASGGTSAVRTKEEALQGDKGLALGDALREEPLVKISGALARSEGSGEGV